MRRRSDRSTADLEPRVLWQRPGSERPYLAGAARRAETVSLALPQRLQLEVRYPEDRQPSDATARRSRTAVLANWRRGRLFTQGGKAGLDADVAGGARRRHCRLYRLSGGAIVSDQRGPGRAVRWRYWRRRLRLCRPRHHRSGVEVRRGPAALASGYLGRPSFPASAEPAALGGTQRDPQGSSFRRNGE